ncbi:MAG TPA: MFS transporter, partial [Thermoleophilia bacterium]|nr:MFS transporter [Thermoleophilia bacterium]
MPPLEDGERAARPSDSIWTMSPAFVTGVQTGGRLRRLYHAFPRQFWLLVAGFMFLMTGIDMCFPFETTYLTTRLGASISTVGLMIGIPAMAVLPLYALDGAIADRYGRKPAMIAGICVLVALYSTFGLSRSLWPIAVMIAIEAPFGWALFLTGSNAMVADLVSGPRRAEAYSLTRVALDVGITLGPLIAGLVIAADPTFHSLFLGGATICAAFVLILALLFRETRPAVAAHHEVALAKTLRGYGVVLRDRRFLAFCGVSLLPLYCFGQIWVVFPIALRQQHGVSAQQWGYLLAFYAIAGAVAQYPVIRWLRGRDHVRALAVASACIGIGLGGAVMAPAGVATYGFMLAISFGVVLLIPLTATVAAELAPVALRGRYMGAWTLVQMGGYGLGPTFGGLALGRLGPSKAAVVTACAGLAGGVLFAATARRFASGVTPGAGAGEPEGAPAP